MHNVLQLMLLRKIARNRLRRARQHEYETIITALEQGMALNKCRHNGTNSVSKTFILVGNELRWNGGFFSKGNKGIALKPGTQVSHVRYMCYDARTMFKIVAYDVIIVDRDGYS